MGTDHRGSHGVLNAKPETCWCQSTQLGNPAKAPSQIAVELSDFEALRAFGGQRSHRQLLSGRLVKGDSASEPPLARPHDFSVALGCQRTTLVV